MTLTHQFFGQIRNNSLGSAIAFRGNAFKQWRYLRNSHALPGSVGFERLPVMIDCASLLLIERPGRQQFSAMDLMKMERRMDWA